MTSVETSVGEVILSWMELGTGPYLTQADALKFEKRCETFAVPEVHTGLGCNEAAGIPSEETGDPECMPYSVFADINMGHLAKVFLWCQIVEYNCTGGQPYVGESKDWETVVD